MGNKRLDLHAPERGQAQKFLHVAVFCPANIGEGIVLPAVLVRRIVTAGTIGPDHQELDLLTIHLVPREVQFYGADIHDAATVAANLHRELTRSC